MAGKVYGYLSIGWQEQMHAAQVIPALKAMDADGVYCLDSCPNQELIDLADSVRAEGMDFILGFRWPSRGRSPHEVDMDRLSAALRVSNRLAIANTSTMEWYGGMEKSARAGRREARMYLKVAHRNKFQWVCCITHRTICHDIFDKGQLKPVLMDTPCICLCGYILAGYVHGDVRMPHQRSTSLGKGQLFATYGLTADRLAGWLDGIDCLTGAGFQKGIDGGSRVYAEKLGFSGVCSGMPVDMTHSLDHDTLPPMKVPPKYCGVWNDYQNNHLIRDGEKEWMNRDGPEQGMGNPMDIKK